MKRTLCIEFHIFPKSNIYCQDTLSYVLVQKTLDLRNISSCIFSDDCFLDSLHKSFLNQTSLDLRKKKWTFLNQDFTVLLLEKKPNLSNDINVPFANV